jgi:hypothetical protein
MSNNSTYLLDSFAGNGDKVAKHVCKDFGISATHGEHVTPGSIATVLSISGQQHRGHLKAFIEEKFSFGEACQLNNDQCIIVANVSTVGVRQCL